MKKIKTAAQGVLGIITIKMAGGFPWGGGLPDGGWPGALNLKEIDKA